MAVGTPVNFERAMKLNQRIGGHLVAGHVDGVGVIRSRRQEGVTTLGLKQVNDPVNLEVDLIGKYVDRLLQERSQLPKPSPIIDKDYLQKRGLICLPGLRPLGIRPSVPILYVARREKKCGDAQGEEPGPLSEPGS
jgi:hypothetical protein